MQFNDEVQNCISGLFVLLGEFLFCMNSARAMAPYILLAWRYKPGSIPNLWFRTLATDILSDPWSSGGYWLSFRPGPGSWSWAGGGQSSGSGYGAGSVPAHRYWPILSYPILSYPILSYPILSYPRLLAAGCMEFRFWPGICQGGL